MRITLESGSERLITPSGSSGGVKGLLLPFSTRPFVSRAVAAPSLIGLDRGQVDPMVLLKPLERLDQPIVAITRDARALAGAMGFQLAPRDPEPLDPTSQRRSTGRAEHHLLQVHLQLLRLRLGSSRRAGFALR